MTTKTTETDPSISPAQYVVVALIAYWNRELGRPVTDYITPSEWRFQHRSLVPLARAGVIKYDPELDVARIQDHFEDYATKAANFYHYGSENPL